MIRRKKLKRRLRFAAVLLFLSLCAVALFCDTYIRPLVVSAAEDAAVKQVNIAVNRAISEILSDNNEKYSGITATVYGDNNSVKSVKTDAVKLNLLKSDIEACIANTASKSSGGKVEISLGTLIGNDWTLGRGPNLSFKFDTENTSVGEFYDSFTAAGINQTKYSLRLKVTTDIVLLIPWHTERVSVKTDVVIADQIIVGQTPNSYTSVNVDKER